MADKDLLSFLADFIVDSSQFALPSFGKGFDIAWPSFGKDFLLGDGSVLSAIIQ